MNPECAVIETTRGTNLLWCQRWHERKILHKTHTSPWWRRPSSRQREPWREHLSVTLSYPFSRTGRLVQSHLRKRTWGTYRRWLIWTVDAPILWVQIVHDNSFFPIRCCKTWKQDGDSLQQSSSLDPVFYPSHNTPQHQMRWYSKAGSCREGYSTKFAANRYLLSSPSPTWDVRSWHQGSLVAWDRDLLQDEMKNRN